MQGRQASSAERGRNALADQYQLVFADVEDGRALGIEARGYRLSQQAHELGVIDLYAGIA
jgi:hypothetical protein